jgi:translation initiation factor IF-3
MEGRQMVMVLSPKKKEIKIAKPKESKPKTIRQNGAAPDSNPVQP